MTTEAIKRPRIKGRSRHYHANNAISPIYNEKTNVCNSWVRTQNNLRPASHGGHPRHSRSPGTHGAIDRKNRNATVKRTATEMNSECRSKETKTHTPGPDGGDVDPAGPATSGDLRRGDGPVGVDGNSVALRWLVRRARAVKTRKNIKKLNLNIFAKK